MQKYKYLKFMLMIVLCIFIAYIPSCLFLGGDTAPVEGEVFPSKGPYQLSYGASPIKTTVSFSTYLYMWIFSKLVWLSIILTVICAWIEINYNKRKEENNEDISK